jgi:hypothetical protein
MPAPPRLPRPLAPSLSGVVVSRHWLILDTDPDGETEYGIEHDPDCPTHLEYDGRVLVHDCAVGAHLAFAGLDAFGDGEFDDLAAGRYEIEAWSEKHFVWRYGTYEYESGLRLVGEQA